MRETNGGSSAADAGERTGEELADSGLARNGGDQGALPMTDHTALCTNLECSDLSGRGFATKILRSHCAIPVLDSPNFISAGNNRGSWLSYPQMRMRIVIEYFRVDWDFLAKVSMQIVAAYPSSQCVAIDELKLSYQSAPGDAS